MFAYTGGLQGIQGIQGDTGDAGIQGDIGIQGIQGDTGEQGIQGEPGEAGVTNASQHVSRAGASGWDYTKNDFTVNENWNDLDLSAICPAGTTMIHLALHLYSASDELEIQWRRNGYTGSRVLIRCLSGAYASSFFYPFWVGCDENRVIEYNAQIGNWTNIDLIVLDYIKDAEVA